MKLSDFKYNVHVYIQWSGKYILINIERVSEHSVTILGLHVVTPAWSMLDILIPHQLYTYYK